VLQVYHIPTLMTMLLMPAALAGSCCASWCQAYSMHVIVQHTAAPSTENSRHKLHLAATGRTVWPHHALGVTPAGEGAREMATPTPMQMA
jgi:hypothetical protein